MRVAEGTCGCCGEYVFYDEARRVYVAARDKQITCSPPGEQHVVTTPSERP